MVVTEVIEVPRSVEESFAYVADFTTVAEWDPGIHESRKVSGDGGVGTVYEVQAEFRGKTMPFTYTVTALEAERPHRPRRRGGEGDVARHDRVRAGRRRRDAHHLQRRLQAQGRRCGSPSRSSAARSSRSRRKALAGLEAKLGAAGLRSRLKGA